MCRRCGGAGFATTLGGSADIGSARKSVLHTPCPNPRRPLRELSHRFAHGRLSRLRQPSSKPKPMRNYVTWPPMDLDDTRRQQTPPARRWNTNTNLHPCGVVWAIAILHNLLPSKSEAQAPSTLAGGGARPGAATPKPASRKQETLSIAFEGKISFATNTPPPRSPCRPQRPEALVCQCGELQVER